MKALLTEGPAAPVPLRGCSRGNAPLQHRLRVEVREKQLSTDGTERRGRNLAFSPLPPPLL